MVGGISSDLPGTISVPGTTGQSRIAALETAFPGLRVLGAQSTADAPTADGGKSAVGAGQKPPLASGDTLLAAQQQGGGAATGQSAPQVPGQLSDEDKQQIAKLRQIDARVRAHERAHAAVGGQYAGAPSYSYSRGPDGQQYAVGGEVAIDIGAERDPEATLQKARQVAAAALAPADPSGQDRAVAAAAAQLQLQALDQIRKEKRAEQAQQQAARDADRAAAAGRQQAAQATGPAAAAGVPSGPAPPPAAPGSQTPAARASSAYANDNAGLNRLVGQIVGLSA